MDLILSVLFGGVWLVGGCLRLYRQARYYQIEEYMSGRYLRWLARDLRRLLPIRAVVAGLASVFLIGVVFPTSENVIFAIIALVLAVVAVYPPPLGEVKKAFRATPRAKRLLATGFALVALIVLIGVLMARGLLSLGAQLTVISAVGLATFLAIPLVLVLANIVMTPVEAAFRRRFVENARRTLAAIQPVVIGITGSYGKTSTKNIMAHILGGRFRAYATPKSYNTLMGVSLAINTELADRYDTDYFISEMGAYVTGEIAEICDLTKPIYGVIVDVGPQHLERFGTLAHVAEAKYEIIKALPADGVGVFNWDNPLVREMYERAYPQTRLAVSREADPDSADAPRFVASEIRESLDGLAFVVTDRESGEREAFDTPIVGQHNVTNILLAVAVARHAGMPLAEIERRVRTAQPAESRLTRTLTPEGLTIINDAYSANPVGAVSALQVLGLHTTGKRLLITPGMVELGAVEAAENRKLGAAAAQYATDVILVGALQTAPIREGLLSAGFAADRVLVVETLAEAMAWYQQHLGAGDTVLFLNDLPDTYARS